MTTVLFPWARGCPHRDAAAGWVMRQWTRHHPDIPAVTTGHPLAGGPWRKGLHLGRLAEQAPDGVCTVSDVDVWTAPHAIHAAIQAVQGGAPWAIPHGDVYRLTPASTAALVADGTDLLLQRLGDMDLDEPPYPGHPGGGLVVLTRGSIAAVPMDPRFQGWGQEDDAWGLALTTMLGPPWRGTDPLIHLWHPPQPRETRHRGSRAGLALYQRYQDGARHPGTIQAILNEIGD